MVISILVQNSLFMKTSLFLIIFIAVQPLFASDYLEYLGIGDDRPEEVKKKLNNEEFTALPNLPQEAKLVTFAGASAYPQYRYAIDEETLSVGKIDGLVRFIIVISSNSGVANTYYQGISCKEKQIKTYASATSSAKKFTTFGTPTWSRVTGNGSMGYSKDLAEFYFCDLLGSVLTRKEILDNLKYDKSTEGDLLD